MRSSELTGTKEVFKFTIAQYLKSKSTIVTMLILALVSLGSLLIATYSMQSAQSQFSIEAINIENSTPIAVSTKQIAQADAAFEGLLESKEADVTLYVAMEDGAYVVTAEGDAPANELRALENAALSAFNAARSGAMQAYESRVLTLDEYLNPVEEVDLNSSFTATYVYGVIVLMLVMMSASYIVRSVIEEKASRLVETLVISVSPLALIVGKILACMCLVVMQLLVMAIGVGAAVLISVYILDSNAVIELISSISALSALENLNAAAILGALISIFLGFMTFAEIGGISAACCDRMEDLNSATSAVTLPAMAGYILGCMAPAFDGVVGTVLSLVPFASIFVAPVKYMTGEITIWILLISWLIQAAVVVGLAVFGNRVYASIIIHRGSRIKLSSLIGMARKGGDAA